jgi:hypothetical protein
MDSSATGPTAPPSLSLSTLVPVAAPARGQHRLDHRAGTPPPALTSGLTGHARQPGSPAADRRAAPASTATNPRHPERRQAGPSRRRAEPTVAGLPARGPATGISGFLTSVRAVNASNRGSRCGSGIPVSLDLQLVLIGIHQFPECVLVAGPGPGRQVRRHGVFLPSVRFLPLRSEVLTPPGAGIGRSAPPQGENRRIRTEASRIPHAGPGS